MSSPVNPSSSSDNNQTGEDTTLTYGIIGTVVAIVAIVAAVFLLRSRKPKKLTKNPPTEVESKYKRRQKIAKKS